MKAITTQEPFSSVVAEEDKCDPRPQYQRGAVWNDIKKQRLIDSLLRGYDIPKIYLREIDRAPYETEIVDGQQRLTAIWQFCDNKYPLAAVSNDIPGMPKLEGKFYKDLPRIIRNNLNSAKLSICEIRKASDSEIKRMFRRLQEGMSLVPAEYRNAMEGNMRDFIDSMAGHKVFKSVKIKDSRYTYADWIAHVVHAELKKFSQHMKAANLLSMYKTEESFDLNGKAAKKIKKVLTFMHSSLGPSTSTPEMDIKWGFVDLYFLISSLMETHVISSKKGSFRKFFREFEKERRKFNSNPTNLTKGSWENQLLFDYIDKFNRSGGDKKNLQGRHEIYKALFFNDNPKLVPKDPKRLFNSGERMLLWHRADEKCEAKSCGNKITLSDMEADHIKEHSQGGLTTIENGQCLCKNCHKKKTSVS
jgi:hypothetical protein